tara:strand:- start:4135 stop:4371 length:237 start_codon:yes stop_codon:yes gene_type:complete
MTADQIIAIERALAIERYTNLCAGNSIGLSVALGLNEKDIILISSIMNSKIIHKHINDNIENTIKSIKRSRNKYHFIN